MTRYQALVGMNLGKDDTRYEPGDTLPDGALDEATAQSWVEQGLLSSEAKKKAAPKKPEVVEISAHDGAVVSGEAG